jgi:uncharacterized protein (DUF2164 family)
MAIALPQDKRQQLAASLKRYLVEHLDPDAGDLKVSLLLDFCVTEIGAVVYNQAIADAQAYFQARVSDLEAICFADEFSYWPKSRR